MALARVGVRWRVAHKQSDTYGFVGTAKALRNLNLIQRELVPQLLSLDLFANPPRLAAPVHYVFCEQDPLTPAATVKQLPVAIAAPAKTVILVPDAGIWCILTNPRQCVPLR